MIKCDKLVLLIQQLVASNQVNLIDLTAAGSFVLGEALGHSLALPTSVVANPTRWYKETHQTNVFSLLNSVNETHVIDMDEVEEISFKLWLCRYTMVFCPESASSRMLVHKLIESGACEVPARYVKLVNDYLLLHVNQDIVSNVQETAFL